jgi:hypothetical protein
MHVLVAASSSQVAAVCERTSLSCALLPTSRFLIKHDLPEFKRQFAFKLSPVNNRRFDSGKSLDLQACQLGEERM